MDIFLRVKMDEMYKIMIPWTIDSTVETCTAYGMELFFIAIDTIVDAAHRILFDGVCSCPACGNYG